MNVRRQLLKGLKLSIKFSNTWREDGLTSKKFQESVSFYYLRNNPKSRNPGFAEEPIKLGLQ
jgi:hypothetical protein